ncbi:MAG TPA: EAL domain-containing protein [Bacillales bacterium]|nr:EAL domain-containing protein [Bacillales bacterium]
MTRSCEICNPEPSQYLVRFQETSTAEQLSLYFSNTGLWKPVSETVFAMQETDFYSLIDYIDAHPPHSEVTAMRCKRITETPDSTKMKPLEAFQAEREVSWIDTLIEERRLCTYYQPIVKMEDSQPAIIGHELLSRGLGENNEIIPPSRIFEAARTRNRLFALDRACRLESIRNAAQIRDKMLFVNFIPTAIYVPEHCLSTTFELIRMVGLAPENIVFEVVETDEVENLEHLKSILRYYKEHGFRFALDDVGTGHNKVSKLRDLEPDVVKLALEFTRGVSKDTSKQETAKNVLNIAKSMGASCLAEGIEDQEDLNYLNHLGYDLYQGYFFSKPVPEPVVSLSF